METARSMVIGSKLPNILWAEEFQSACYILNRCATKALDKITPEEKFSGLKPDVSHLRIYGCAAYLHIPKSSRDKLYPKASKTTLVGYDENTKGYRCFDPIKRKVLICRDVTFDESMLGIDSIQEQQEDMFPPTPTKTAPDDAPTMADEHQSSPAELEDRRQAVPEPHLEFPTENDGPEERLSPTNSNPRQSPTQSLPRKSCRIRRTPSYSKDFHLFNTETCDNSLVIIKDEELNFQEAFQYEDWRQAMRAEMDCIKKNNTWTLEDLPSSDKKPITAKWCYKIKPGTNGAT